MRARHKGGQSRNYPEVRPPRGTHTEGMTRASHGQPGFSKRRQPDLLDEDVLSVGRLGMSPLFLCSHAVEFVATDESWKVLNITGSSAPSGWSEPGFDDSDWARAESLVGLSGLTVIWENSDSVPGTEVLFRKEYIVADDDLSGADVLFKYALDNAGRIYVNGVEVASLLPLFTNTATHWNSDHATTLARSVFRAGVNCVAIYVTNDSAGSVGATPPGQTSAGVYIEMPTGGGAASGDSESAARCDHPHTHNELLGRDGVQQHPASGITESTYGDVQTAIDNLGLGWVLVTAHGATGDGTTDDTAAIQAALDAVDAAGGGTLYFPIGTYKITSELNWDGSFLHILGAGTAYGGSAIKQTTADLGVFNFNTIVTSEQRSAQPPLIQNITLRGTGFDDTGTSAGTWQWNEVSTAGDGIYALADVWLQNVSVEGFYNGVRFGTDSWYSRIENSIFWQNANNGVLIADGNNLSLTNCRFGFNGQDLWAEDIWGLRAVGCSFEQQKTGYWSVVLDDNGINGTRGILFAGCYFETGQGLGALRIGDAGTVEAVEVVGCIFGNVSPANYKHISINHARNVTISGCEIGSTGAGGVPIDASATNTSDLVLINNDITGTPTNLPASTIYIDPSQSITPEPNGTAAAGTSMHYARADHVHEGGGIGEILISDTPSTPLVFADLLQNEAQDDLLYGDS